MQYVSLLEIFNVVTQIGLAVTGAAALWGGVFSLGVRKKPEEHDAYARIIKAIFGLFIGAFILTHAGVIGKFAFVPSELMAHEGIIISPSIADTARGLLATVPTLFLFSVVGFVNIFLFFYRGKEHASRAYPLFFAQFVLAFAAMSTLYLDESLGAVQLFYAGHSFHSIFTLGTVLVLDLLYFVSHHIPELRPALYSRFDTMSKVIWFGLGIDFLSVWLIFDQGFVLHDKFYFMQSVVAVLIMNGAMLSGPMTAALRKALSGIPMTKQFAVIAGISGAVSVSSWLSITLVDGFSKLPFSYGEYLIGYAILISLAAITHFAFLDREPGRKLAIRIAGV